MEAVSLLDKCSRVTGHARDAEAQSTNFLSSRMSPDSDNFSAVIATEQNAVIRETAEAEEIATIEVLAPCTRAIGPAQVAEPLSTNFLSNRMSPDSDNFSAVIATEQDADKKIKK
jgi:hypothetical protein